MKQDAKCLVVFDNDRINPLGSIQSLGKVGIKGIAACWSDRIGRWESSNFLNKIHFGTSAEECLGFLLRVILDGEIGVITLCCDEVAITIYKPRKKDYLWNAVVFQMQRLQYLQLLRANYKNYSIKT